MPAALSDVIPATGTSLVPKSFDGSTTPVAIRFYGPIQFSEDFGSWTDSITVECAPLFYASGPCDASEPWQGVTSMFTATGPTLSTTGTAARTLFIGRSSSNALVPPGLYRVK